MFNGFKKKFVKVNKGKIFCRFKGNGPPLLLLHGYPQSHVMWHKTAPELSKYFTVIVADLRGYGDHRDLHSFPTRRSSDLYKTCTEWQEIIEIKLWL